MGFGCDGEEVSDGIFQWAVIYQVLVSMLSADYSSFFVLLCLLCLQSIFRMYDSCRGGTVDGLSTD